MLKPWFSFGILVVFSCWWSPSTGQETSGRTTNGYKYATARNSCPAACRLDVDEGPCSQSWKIKWYYNKCIQKCLFFEYGGCEGNANRFDSKRLCKEKCGECRGHSASVLVAGSQDPTCDCHFDGQGGRYGKGCKISVAPPSGFQCKSRVNFQRWTCDGFAERCSDGENCLAHCTSKECCERGGGNCGGYPFITSTNRTRKTSH